MRILITGGSGFIGQLLCDRLARAGHELLVVSRSPSRTAEVLPQDTDIRAEVLDFVDAQPEAVVNLAGEPIAEGRWTDEKKRRIVESRVETTRAVVELCGQLDSPPKVLVSASAVGYYGAQGDADVTEETEPNEEFLHEICDRWETEAEKAAEHGVRVAIPRIGLVLDRDGGMLKKMLPAFKFGLGSKLGDGSQY
ncbi:MAG: TIGR01777 family oxidoreductase, partial [Candidatus Wenzhouxiangella sp. M2_3B_020]